jgi:tRNA (guanine9-N1)-methyltransferase
MDVSSSTEVIVSHIVANGVDEITDTADVNDCNRSTTIPITIALPDDEILSKNQRKRKLKGEHLESIKLLKRKAAKLRKKERKSHVRLQESTNNILVPVLNEDSNDDRGDKSSVVHLDKEISTIMYKSPILSRIDHKDKAKLERIEVCGRNWSIIIDCDWENIHGERPLKSLAQQILFCYGINNRSPHPCFLHLTGVGTRLANQLEKSNVDKWNCVSVTSSEYSIPLHEGKEVVYLTSDSEDTITDLVTNIAYVIGGIVDRNAHKGITYKKAMEQGIRTAKLPIREHCDITSSAVLTVNQIFEIMIKYGDSKCWATAISSVIPLRKQKS